jgi:hypothetical protein
VSDAGGLSKLRLSAARGDRRLLKGYGPLAALLVAFVLMAMLVPTIAPTQEVVHDTRTVNGGSSVGGTGGGTSTGTTVPGSSTGTGAGTGSGTGSGSGSNVVTKAATGKSSACPGGQTRQVTGDPYAPSCVVFSGNNGGATSPGVTGTTINMSYRLAQGSQSFEQTLQQLGGADITDTNADIERTTNALVQYFNTHYQFYGRKIVINYFNGQGNEANELEGTGQQQADADAVTVAQQIHAFGELNGTTEPYDVALAEQHVMTFGAPYLAGSFMAQYAPYMWSTDAECNDVVAATQQFVLNSLAGGNAQYAGGSLQGQPRKYAIVYPNDPWYAGCAATAVAQAKAAGFPITDVIPYDFNLATLSSQAASIVSKLQADGITTVECGCDPITPIYLTSRAQEQGYTPEWVVAGTAFTDTDIVGQLFQQNEWSHAFGITFLGPTLQKEDTFGYAAYKAEDPGTEPANAVDAIYEQLLLVAIGIQQAGPDLTPANFEAGMRNYPGNVQGATNLFYGAWTFPSGHFTPESDMAFIYWDPNKISAYNDQQGAYVVAPTRYGVGDYPKQSPGLPSTFPITPNSSSSSG